jgi:GDP-L-fucose synthase
MIEANVIHAAFKAGIQRLLLLGSSCIYPKHAPQPIKEEHLLTGPLEPTNAPYAVAKIAGIQLCEAYNRQHGTRYRAVMPTNLYGPNDYFDLENAHVLPALIRKFHLAKLAGSGDMAGIEADERRFGPISGSIKSALGISGSNLVNTEPRVGLWGTGTPFREFIHVDDMADACLFVMRLADDAFDECTSALGFPFVNVGCGEDLTIRDLSAMVAEVVGFEGRVLWDRNRSDGTPRKLLDVSRLAGLGWSPKIQLADGIQKTYRWYLEAVSEDGCNED